MTRKREKPILTAPLSSGDYEAAVAAFIRDRGVTRRPAACLVRTQASVPEADRAALEHYEAAREQDMRQNPVGEPAATAALNFGTPRRRSSLKRLCPFCHCRQRYERNLRRIHASRFVSTRGVWQKPK